MAKGIPDGVLDIGPISRARQTLRSLACRGNVEAIVLDELITEFTALAAGTGNLPALTSDPPAAVTDGAPVVGISTEASHADHQHAHGDLSGGTLHALATILVAGFMSPADKAKLDSVVAASTRSWDFETVNTGKSYIGGFYEFSGTDNDFSPSTTLGHVNRAVSAHVLLVIGVVAVGEVQVTVTGTSITDAGVRTTSDSEVIVIPNAAAADSYFETSKKWIGQVTIETTAGTAITCNFGFSKYHDNNNQDFVIAGLEALWQSESTDTASDIALLHHKATGWTFNAAADPTPPTAIARRSIDLGAENGHQNGFPGAWKRSNLSAAIAGSGSEGVIIEVTSGSAGVGNQSFRQLDFELSLTLG